MNCPNCGTGNAPEAFVCTSCGTSLVSATPSADPPPTQPAPDQPAPTQPSPGQPAPGQPAPGQPAPGQPAPPPGAPSTPPPGYAPPGQPSAPPPQPPPGAFPGYPPPGTAQYPPQPGQPQPGQPQPGQPGAPGGPPPGAPGYPPPGPGQPPPGQYPPGAQYPPGFGPPPSYPPAGGPAGPGGGKNNRGVVFALLGVLLVVAVAAAAFIVTREDETGTSVGASVTLEPVSSTGTDPFSENLDEEDFAEPLEIALEGFPDLGQDVAASLAGRVAGGDEPGLYGGSQETGVCDIGALVDFLTDEANADKAAAWAQTLGIETSEIESYVEGLTPVRLRFDTRVTNHGFRDGQATPFQSLLQAGTGVLVDDQGVPRVKCNCGNPLLEPQDLADIPGDEEDRTLELPFVAANPDDAWDGLDPQNVVAIEPGDVADAFTLVDLDSGRLFERPIGTNGEEDEFVDSDEAETLCESLPDSPTCELTELGSGDVTLTLEWASEADLDLHVFEPDGTEISWETTSSPSGGALDLDSNAQCAPGPAVEHIVWPTGSAPSGEYIVQVHGFDFTNDEGGSCGSGDYTLTIEVGGEETVYEGTVGEDETDEYSFSV